MMKRVLLALCLIGAVTLSQAQSPAGYYLIENANAGVNPGSLNTNQEEPFGGGLPADWAAIHLGAAQFSAWSPIQNIPFVFYFNGEAVFQYKVSTSGVLTFSTAATAVPSYSNKAMPSLEIPDKSVFVWGMKGNYAENRIMTKVFGTAGSRQLWISFNAYNYNGGNAICKMYWSIVLEEGTNNIYVVDQRKSFVCIPKLSVGLLINQNTFVEVPGSPNIASKAGDDPTPTDNSFYQFIPGEQPRRDIETITIEVADLVQLKDAPVPMKGTFATYGTEALKSFDFNYQINGGAVQSTHYSGPVNLQSLEHGIPWIPTAEGNYLIKMWLGLPNGKADQRPSNDTLTKLVTVLEELPIRKVLVEEATQHNCGPCAAVNPAFDAMLQANFADVAPVKYASHWPGANNDWRRKFNEPHHSAMVTYWGVSGVPTGFVDGAFLEANPGSINQGTIDQRKGKSGVFAMDFTEAVNGSDIDISVDVENLIDMEGKNLMLRIAIVQDEKFFATATGTNGEKEFFDIMRYMVPSPNGTILATQAGATETVNFTYPIDPAFRESIIRVVAWVMDVDTREVYMTDKSTGIYLCAGSGFMSGSINATDASCLGNDGSLSVFPTGGSGNYTYSWSNGATTPTLNNVGPGNYTVTVSDGANCNMKFYTSVSQAAPAKVKLTARQETCPGAADGKVDLYLNGGTAPYTFNWSNGATTQNINTLAPGNYSLTVTDANGCITPNVGVSVKSATVASTGTVSSTPDNGSSNGTATASASGGTHPYTFTWDNGMMGEEITGLAAGTYTVTVTDYYGCAAGTKTVTVDSNVGIEDQLAGAGIELLEAFPNPTEGILRLKVTLAQMDDLSVRLYDVNGREIYTETVNSLKYQNDLNLSDLPAGVYTLFLQTSKGSAAQRVVRQ
ncbi:MAG: T9SS type A sorting domain-containing protein [Bacteroidia bacterium]|nr:T9SS type A sorting domain-containing protein [Bacteroidia bacterium]